ncbi:O-antigen ligase family protein [Chitinimonas arctica]|uniref:O-antigen ligase family protein n=1 Tax=Chitinimonas arctica TaxID=2594795 RepID=A0A516SGW8_9NEIS|nr:O-antigen ligase family protein [Chitinimonas arctica]QDQ27268.1 O-antigen ligase family protein [Chitinimonas arctica]
MRLPTLPSHWLVTLIGMLAGLATASFIAMPTLSAQAIRLLTILTVLTVPLYWRARRTLFERDDILPALGLLSWAAYLLLSAALRGEPDTGLSFARQCLWALALLALLRWRRPDPNWLWGGLALAAVGAGAWAFWQVFADGLDRAEGRWYPIIFGNMALIAGCLPLLAWRLGALAPGWRALAWLGAGGGVAASQLSGSRGGWLALLLLGPLWLLRLQSNRRERAKALLVFTLLVGTVGLLGMNRLSSVIDDLNAYREGSLATSLGGRFALWRLAGQMALERPLTGYGPAGFHPRVLAEAQAGRLPSFAAELTHAHNDALHVLATGGVIGLAALLLFFALPAWYFWRRRHLPHASLALTLLAALAICGLSEAMLLQQPIARLLPFLLAAFWAASGPRLGASLPLSRRSPSQ